MIMLLQRAKTGKNLVRVAVLLACHPLRHPFREEGAFHEHRRVAQPLMPPGGNRIGFQFNDGLKLCLGLLPEASFLAAVEPCAAPKGHHCDDQHRDQPT